MWDLLRDPMWQFVGVLAAILGLGIAGISFLKTRQTKSLSYQVIADEPLLSVNLSGIIKGRVNITLDEQPVRRVNLILVRIINSGNQPISSKDYESPITINFGRMARVILAEVYEQNPDALRPLIKIQGSKVEISPILLNQGDWMKLKVMAADYNGPFRVDGRILGVKCIEESRIGEDKFTKLFAYVSLLMIFLGIPLSFVGRHDVDPSRYAMYTVVWNVSGILMTVGIIFLLLFARRSSKREAELSDLSSAISYQSADHKLKERSYVDLDTASRNNQDPNTLKP
jgi:hypothetical protein